MKRSRTGAVLVDGPSEEYEQACLEAVRRQMLGSEALQRDGVVVKSVELVRSKDCRCIVAFLVRHGHDTREVWRLYEDVFNGTLPPGQAEDPDSVALQMVIWAMGG